MKMKLNFMVGLLSLFMAFGMFSCSDKNKEPSIDNTVYKVNCEKSDYYTYGGTVNATGGIEAKFEVTSNYPAYEIVGCTFNGNECEVTSQLDSGKKFSFIMPNSDVEIKVIGKWNDLEASGTNNFLSFDSDNEYTTQTAINDDTYDNDQNFGSPLHLKFTTDAGFMTIANITCFSTNEDILPNNGIEYNTVTSSSSNVITGGNIFIDRSKAKVGTTQIVLRVKSGNNNSYDAIIVATITIVE